jgi:hypothetical protein
MPQTVFDVGDPITSRLKLGMTPDPVLTVASVKVYRPTGVELLGLTASGWLGADGDEKTVQWFATDDGTAGGPTLAAAGDWLAVWKVTGPGAAIAPKVYNVNPLPSTGTRPVWSPFLSDVADHVPWLTVDTATPGSQVYLGTFTGWTTPTDEQAQRHVDNAVTVTGALLGTLPSGVYRLARTVAAVRAAAALARAFPRNRADLDTADQLAAQAATDLKVLTTAAEVAGSSPPSNPLPVLIAPLPPWYGDIDL